MPLVKNLKGTASKSCNCRSWLDHWKRFSGSFLFGCSNIHCSNNPEVGAHVKKINDPRHYIIPLCKSCNGLSEEFTVGFNVTFTPENIQKTCGK